MNEALTIAKVRTPTRVAIPAGGYVIIVGPEKSFSEHQAARTKLVTEGSDAFESVIIGRLRNTHPTVKFLTTDQKEAMEKEAARNNKALEKSAEEAAERQKALDAEKVKKEQDTHATRIEAINKVNDSIREKK